MFAFHFLSGLLLQELIAQAPFSNTHSLATGRPRLLVQYEGKVEEEVVGSNPDWVVANA